MLLARAMPERLAGLVTVAAAPDFTERGFRAGFSEAVTIFPYSRLMKDRFLAAQRQAKRQRLGIWSNSQPSLPAASR